MNKTQNKTQNYKMWWRALRLRDEPTDGYNKAQMLSEDFIRHYNGHSEKIKQNKIIQSKL